MRRRAIRTVDTAAAAAIGKRDKIRGERVNKCNNDGTYDELDSRLEYLKKKKKALAVEKR